MAKYSFSVKLWRWPGDAAWHFLTVPKVESEKIKKITKGVRRGFGSVKVEATIGKSSWRTSIFPDSKSGTFLLPVKASVRRHEGIDAGDSVKTKIELV